MCSNIIIISPYSKYDIYHDEQLQNNVFLCFYTFKVYLRSLHRTWQIIVILYVDQIELMLRRKTSEYHCSPLVRMYYSKSKLRTKSDLSFYITVTEIGLTHSCRCFDKKKLYVFKDEIACFYVIYVLLFNSPSVAPKVVYSLYNMLFVFSYRF